jgi:hypothetical protein
VECTAKEGKLGRFGALPLDSTKYLNVLDELRAVNSPHGKMEKKKCIC